MTTTKTPQEIVDWLREKLKNPHTQVYLIISRDDAQTLVTYFDDLDKARAELLGGR